MHLSRKCPVPFVMLLVFTMSGTLVAQVREKSAGPLKGGAGNQFSDSQKAALKQLQADLRKIQQQSEATQEQKESLKKSLAAMADGATKPDPASIDKLAADLSEALADGNLTNAELLRLAQSLQAVLNSANIPQEEIKQTISDAQALLAAKGIEKGDLDKIVADLKQIAQETASRSAGRVKLNR